MKRIAMMSVLATTLLASAVAAACKGDISADTAANCVPGMIWDEARAACVAQPSS